MVRSRSADAARRCRRTTPPQGRPTGAPGGVGLAPPTAHTAHAHPARSPVGPLQPAAAQPKTTYSAGHATLSRMTVRELLAEPQHLPRDLEVLVFEAGCEDYCEREVDEVQWQAAGCTC